MADNLQEPLLLKAEELLLPPGCNLTSIGNVSPDQNRVVVCSLQVPPFNSKSWIVIGLCKYRPYDPDYRTFLTLFLRQIEMSVSSIISLAEERQDLEGSVLRANLEKQNLIRALARQTREAAENAWRFLEFARHAPVGVYIFGPSGNIAFANETWYGYFGIPIGTKGAHIWRDRIHPEDLSVVDEGWGGLVAQGKNHINLEFRARVSADLAQASLPGAEWRYLSSTCFAELDEDGKLKSVTGVIVDNTALRMHELEVGERLKTALESKRVQENFMDKSCSSHEMRNPLNAILQSAEEAINLLERGMRDEMNPMAHHTTNELLDILSTISYCGHHQKQIIDDVLTISKLDANLLTIAPARTHPLDVARQALEIYKSDIRIEGIHTSLNSIASCVDTPVMIDPGRVLQILINVVGNAIKFLRTRPRKELRIDVSVVRERPNVQGVKFSTSGTKRATLTNRDESSEQDLVYVLFSVADTGPGIRAREMEQLFERFTQASPRTHAQYGGSGLGLFICRELTELHGGEIGVSSEEGIGTNFSFYVQGYTRPEDARTDRPSLPLGKREASSTLLSSRSVLPDRRHSDRVGSSDQTSQQTHDIEDRGSEIDVALLVVEDNPINQRILVKKLVREGFAAVAASDGEAAIAKILCSSRNASLPSSARPRIDVCLCDLEMPVMDGTTCVRKVRAMQTEGLLRGHLPMIAVTGNARQQLVHDAKAAGFDEVVCKPYNFRDLTVLIRAWAKKQD